MIIPNEQLPPAFRINLHAHPTLSPGSPALVFFSMATSAEAGTTDHMDQLSNLMSLQDTISRSGWRQLTPTLKPFYSHPWTSTVTLSYGAVSLTLGQPRWPHPLYTGRLFPDASIRPAQEWLLRLRASGTVAAYLCHEPGPLPDYEGLQQRVRDNAVHVITTRVTVRGH